MTWMGPIRDVKCSQCGREDAVIYPVGKHGTMVCESCTAPWIAAMVRGMASVEPPKEARA